MKVKNRFRFLLVPAIYFLTFASIYGQEINENDTNPTNALIFNDTTNIIFGTRIVGDTTKMLYFSIPILQFSIDSTTNDAIRVPYLSAKGISFTDSLEKALKNSLSILLEKNEAAKIYIPTFFTSKQQEFCENPTHEKPPFDWFFTALFLFLSMLAFLRLQIPNLSLTVLYKKRQRNSFQRTENLPKTLLFFLQIFASWIGFSLALTEILSFGEFHFPFDPLLFSSIIVFVYFFSKILLKKIFGWVFQLGNIVSDHQSVVVNTNFTWVLIAFFLVIINHYAANNYLIWIICFIFCINFLQKLVGGWIIFSKKLRFFEILLYLCTIEVLPLLLFARYVISYFYKV